eukprot:Sdes_comp23641_c0_seq1m21828
MNLCPCHEFQAVASHQTASHQLCDPKKLFKDCSLLSHSFERLVSASKNDQNLYEIKRILGTSSSSSNDQTFITNFCFRASLERASLLLLMSNQTIIARITDLKKKASHLHQMKWFP